jgi:hypothetical protein
MKGGFDAGYHSTMFPPPVRLLDVQPDAQMRRYRPAPPLPVLLIKPHYSRILRNCRAFIAIRSPSLNIQQYQALTMFWRHNPRPNPSETDTTQSALDMATPEAHI